MSASLKNPQKIVEILYIEDNLDDAALMKKIFKTSRFPIHLNVARNGEKALKMLKEASEFSNKGKPDIILLDLNLPGLSGFEVLAEIKNDKKLDEIPVLVISSSQNDRDIRSAYHHRANFYLVKPMDINHFPELVTYMEKFWLSRIP